MELRFNFWTGAGLYGIQQRWGTYNTSFYCILNDFESLARFSEQKVTGCYDQLERIVLGSKIPEPHPGSAITIGDNFHPAKTITKKEMKEIRRRISTIRPGLTVAVEEDT